MSKLLDCVLGAELGVQYSRRELKQLFTMQDGAGRSSSEPAARRSPQAALLSVQAAQAEEQASTAPTTPSAPGVGSPQGGGREVGSEG